MQQTVDCCLALLLLFKGSLVVRRRGPPALSQGSVCLSLSTCVLGRDVKTESKSWPSCHERNDVRFFFENARNEKIRAAEVSLLSH